LILLALTQSERDSPPKHGIYGLATSKMQNGENQAPSPSSSSFHTADEIENYQREKKILLKPQVQEKGFPKYKKSTLV
jgi:hypothetical protein